MSAMNSLLSICAVCATPESLSIARLAGLEGNYISIALYKVNLRSEILRAVNLKFAQDPDSRATPPTLSRWMSAAQVAEAGIGHNSNVASAFQPPTYFAQRIVDATKRIQVTAERLDQPDRRRGDPRGQGSRGDPHGGNNQGREQGQRPSKKRRVDSGKGGPPAGNSTSPTLKQREKTKPPPQHTYAWPCKKCDALHAKGDKCDFVEGQKITVCFHCGIAGHARKACPHLKSWDLDVIWPGKPQRGDRPALKWLHVDEEPLDDIRPLDSSAAELRHLNVHASTPRDPR